MDKNETHHGYSCKLFSKKLKFKEKDVVLKISSNSDRILISFFLKKAV